MIWEWTVAAFILVGVLFSLLAAIGLLRMPDLYMRIQTSTKSSTLGVSCIAFAAALHFDEVSVTTKAVLIVGFLFLTAPVAAHMIGYAAYVAGVELWPNTVVDELGAAELNHPANPEAAAGPNGPIR